ncbi:MAG: hypothetical protein E7575_06315 [Ruminococcaceae bacterium]|nr:hypothetical protein [Oscillospiraceae bacterium]
MKTAVEVDKNLQVPFEVEKDGILFYNVTKEPFRLFGVIYENEKFRRMPERAAKNISDGVFSLHTNTSGGRVRFRTNSKRIVLDAKMSGIGRMPHFSLTGTAGFDMYIRKSSRDIFSGTFVPHLDITDGYESSLYLDGEMHDITINFPLYSGVDVLLIGIDKDAELLPFSEPYIGEAPIVYYGSSITQGGCASKAGNSYPAIISRQLDRDFVNLGFSGCAKGEKAMAEYIASLPMSLFVMDYDYNAPTKTHLEDTHKSFYEIVRASHPETPIIMISAPTGPNFLDDMKGRKRIIYENYKESVAAGDRNIYFIDGESIFANQTNDGTVEGCHPNDIGFSYMAQTIGDKIAKILR